MLAAEVEHAEVAGGVADNARVVVEDEQRDVAVVVLGGFLAEGAALVAGEADGLGFGVGVGLVDARLVVFEERAVALGACAVGASFGVHLEEAEVESDLDAREAVVALDEADVDLAGLVGPVVEEFGEVEVHGAPGARGGG